jgi:glycosyltransferase involved in cell wall biosynthesis
MKKVLLLTYYFEPANAVATPRIMSWANNFKKHNLSPTIVTRHFYGNEFEWKDFISNCKKPLLTEKNENYELYQLPYEIKRPLILQKNKFVSKAYYFNKFINGNFDLEIDARSTLMVQSRKLLIDNKFDFILVSAPPLNLIKMAAELSREFNIPFIVDFRDIWNNLLTSKDKMKFNLRTRFINYIQEFYLKKWLKKCSLVTSVSPALLEQVQRIYTGKTLEITNGFEEDKFSVIRKIKPSETHFTFSSIGTIYPMQDISILLEGLKKFYKQVEANHDFQLNFIGINAVPEVAKKIEEALFMYKPLLTSKLSREEAFRYYGNSHVLYKSAWKTHKGMYSAKIFEYIGAYRNIIIAPGDNDVVENLILDAGLGHVANTVDEFVAILQNLYAEWRLTKTLKMNAMQDKISYYSREHQAALLAECILNV